MEKPARSQFLFEETKDGYNNTPLLFIEQTVQVSDTTAAKFLLISWFQKNLKQQVLACVPLLIDCNSKLRTFSKLTFN